MSESYSDENTAGAARHQSSAAANEVSGAFAQALLARLHPDADARLLSAALLAEAAQESSLRAAEAPEPGTGRTEGAGVAAVAPRDGRVARGSAALRDGSAHGRASGPGARDGGAGAPDRGGDAPPRRARGAGGGVTGSDPDVRRRGRSHPAGRAGHELRTERGWVARIARIGDTRGVRWSDRVSRPTAEQRCAAIPVTRS